MERGAATDLLDRYRDGRGRAHLTGIDALCRLPIEQVRRDRRAGLDIRAFISGYPGSPLAGIDLELTRRRELLADLGIRHQPAVNEELALTAIAGSQQVSARPDRRCDGVTGYWYGKAPGLERALDALHHANTAGTSPFGGAVLFVGDDPAAKSSTVPSRSWGLLADLAVPVITPSSVHDLLTLGRHAVALSRVSGLWVALVVTTPIADASADVELSDDSFHPVIPPPAFIDDVPFVPHVEPRLLSTISLGLERELVEARIPLARAYLAANGLVHFVNEKAGSTEPAALTIVAAGHTALIVADVVEHLGAGAIIRLVHLGAVWPLDPTNLREAVAGSREVLVIEDKRPFLETILRDALYSLADRPMVTGATDPDGMPLVPMDGWLTAARIEPVIRARLAAHGLDRLIVPARPPRERVVIPVNESRTPWYCSGCPHSVSTKVPDGTLVGVGTGCHAMAIITQPDLDTFGIAQMGGEGAAWIGLGPFVSTRHATQNLGDGTLAHSGESAIRMAVASGANLTFKLLFNDAVAMTGGQSPTGGHTVGDWCERLLHAGVTRIIVTSDDVDRERGALPSSVEVWSRDRLDEAQRVLAEVPGVTVLVHDQPCAAELRRNRKRGRAPEAPRRLFIAASVCEGCGDCAEKSRCLSLHPIDTPLGRKTSIHQSSCNQDESCLDGDCPSFVSVTPADGVTWPTVATPLTDPADEQLPEPGPDLRSVAPTTIRLAGIGGTGVITVSQILAVAAAINGMHATTLDQTGLSQKAGPVVSDLRITSTDAGRSNLAGPEPIDSLIAFDVLVGAAEANIELCDPALTRAVISIAATPTGRQIADGLSDEMDTDAVVARVGATTSHLTVLDAETLSESLFDTATPANLLTIGVAYQLGFLPMPAAAIEAAIEANGVAIEINISAFRHGRGWVIEQGSDAVAPQEPDEVDPLHLRVEHLATYGGSGLVERYRSVVEAMRSAEQPIDSGTPMTTIVIEEFHRLLTPKDEYEVARLMLEPDIRAEAERIGGPGATMTFHLHPPTLRAMGRGHKIEVPERLALPMFRALRAGRRFRGTRLDPFGRTAHRRLERLIASEYEQLCRTVAAGLTASNHSSGMVRLAAARQIRGYESVKEAGIERYRELARHEAATK